MIKQEITENHMQQYNPSLECICNEVTMNEQPYEIRRHKKQLLIPVNIDCFAGKVKTPFDKQAKWQQEARAYRVRLIYQGRSIEFDYWVGKGIRRRPMRTSILYEFTMNYLCKGHDFDQFCNECGYDNDSIRALSIYNAVMQQIKDIDHLFGKDVQKYMSVDWNE